MSDIRLELKNIGKNFGDTKVLKNLSFEVKKGEVLALLGDNGAGKSTLIKIISGIHKPLRGEVFFEGQRLDYNSFNPKIARALGIQTVYQHLGLVDELSIARNFFLGLEPISYFGPFKYLNRSYMRNVVKKELDLMGIKRKLDPDDSIKKLSGGERQAIAIGRARFFGAKLLILDEPTSALSLSQTQSVLDYIKQSANLGISVIFITHTLHHIEQIVDKIAIIHHGSCVGYFNKSEITLKECTELIIHGKTKKYIHKVV